MEVYMNNQLYECIECQGKGYYTVFNAYDYEYRKLEKCEYCNGVGFTKTNILTPIIIPKVETPVK